MEEGRIVRWLKSVGDAVQKGDPVLEVETDKSVFEVEAEGSGILRVALIGDDQIAPVGRTLGYIADPDDEIPHQAPAPAVSLAAASEPTPKSESRPVRSTERIRVTPLARRIAEEHGVDLAMVRASDPGGAISVKDIEDYVASLAVELSASAPKREVAGVYEIEAVEPMSSLRKRIAARLRSSVDTALHVSSTLEVDASALREYAQELSNESGTRVTVTDLVVSQVAQTLTKIPQLNVTCDGEKVTRIKNINIGVAVAVPDGLLVPVVRNADAKSEAEIAIELRSLIDKAKNGGLVPEDYSYGTFTVSNLGMLGVENFTSIINPPEVAILSVGAILDRVRVINGQAMVRPVFKVTLNIDHRVADGIIAAGFLNEFKRRCESLA
jgi:pyruvate dehydrogenase E2 component (dihydrolipoamide acetyltransferase)